jgi:hypothetical protein
MKSTDLADSTRGKYEGLLRLHILPTFGKVERRRLAGAASMVPTWYYEVDRPGAVSFTGRPVIRR